MNASIRQDTAAKAGWDAPRGVPDIAPKSLISDWKTATMAVRDIATIEEWSKSEIARRADIAIGTFSGWYDGTYKGRIDNITTKVENFIAAHHEASLASAVLPTRPEFVETRVARELFESFTIAQALPTMAIVTMAAGLGKTTAAEAYQKQRPHVVLITLSPSILTHNKVLGEILEELGIQNIDKGRTRHNVVKALKRSGGNSLVIVDEAQNLDTDCINELRVAVRDLGGSGLVLLGNEEKKTSYGSAGKKGGSPQLARRVMARTTAMKIYDEDIPVFLDAWGLEDTTLRALAAKVLTKPGAYGSLTETLMAASMIARGNNRSLTGDDLRAAFRGRGEGEI